MSAKTTSTLRKVALGYLVKTLLLGVAWLMIPDLPQRASGVAQQAWAWVAGGPEAR